MCFFVCKGFASVLFHTLEDQKQTVLIVTPEYFFAGNLTLREPRLLLQLFSRHLSLSPFLCFVLCLSCFLPSFMSHAVLHILLYSVACDLIQWFIDLEYRYCAKTHYRLSNCQCPIVFKQISFFFSFLMLWQGAKRWKQTSRTNWEIDMANYSNAQDPNTARNTSTDHFGVSCDWLFCQWGVSRARQQRDGLTGE